MLFLSDSKILAIHVEIEDDKASHRSFKEKIEEVLSERLSQRSSKATAKKRRSAGNMNPAIGT